MPPDEAPLGTASAADIAAALAETPTTTAPAPQPTGAEVANAIREGFSDLSQYFGARQEQVAPRPPTVREQIAALSPDQRAELERRIAANPTAHMIDLAEMMSKEQIAQFQSQAQPFIANTGSLFIDNYVTRKSQEDRLYRQIEPIFKKSVGRINKALLVQMTDAERTAQLDLHWDAAASIVYRNAAAAGSAPQNQAPTMGGSNGVNTPTNRTAGAQARAGRTFSDATLDKDDGLNELAQRLKARGLLEDADIDEINTTYQDVMI
jgi:hypothetical protein